jgi:hypothetical protein
MGVHVSNDGSDYKDVMNSELGKEVSKYVRLCVDAGVL